MNKLFNKINLFYTAITCVLVQRLLHIKDIIEEPMAWRQFDTEFYAYDFYRNGLNLFKPSVAWLGSHKTLILEFPLVSGIISIFYSVFGHSVIYARIVILLFYLGSAFYLYLIVKKLYYERIARLTVLIYLMVPMSLYYSRAINIDFAVMFFSLAALYYFIKGYEHSNYIYIVFASILSTLAFLTKAPYAFYIYIPLVYYIYNIKKVRFFLITIPILVVPALIFILWQNYVIQTNSNAPAWYFIPDYFKFTNMSDWYFGGIDQRFIFENWKTIFERIIAAVTTFIGLPLFLYGMFAKVENGASKRFFYYYMAGLLIYLLIFFNLNRIHDYYQIPFLVISSFFIALAIDSIYRKLKEKSQIRANVIMYVLVFLLMVNSIWFTERWYYRVDYLRYYASEEIRKNTSEDSLVIVSIKDTDPRDPRLLAPSYRYGWSIRLMDLNEALINRLKENGADYLVVISNEKLNNNLTEALNIYQRKETPIYKDNWVVYTFKLN